MLSLAAISLVAQAQTYQVPVSEEHEPMQKGQYEPTWQSLETHQTPEWFRNEVRDDIAAMAKRYGL